MDKQNVIPFIDSDNKLTKISINGVEHNVINIGIKNSEIDSLTYSGEFATPENKIYFIKYTLRGFLVIVEEIICLSEIPNSLIPDFEKNAEFWIEYFNDYLKIFFNCLEKIDYFNSQYNNPTRSSANLVVGFNTKILKHLNTIIIILQNENTGLKILDIHTVKVIIRTIYECIVTFKYVFNYHLKEEEQKFRMLIWQYASAYNTWKQNQSVKNPSEHYKLSSELLEKSKKELMEQIENNAKFNKLGNTLKDKIRNGNWRYNTSFTKLGKWLGLRYEYLDYNYSKLSSSVHNDFNSISLSFTLPALEKMILVDLSYSLNFLIFILLKYYEILRKHYEVNFNDFFITNFENNLDKDSNLIGFLNECRKIENELKNN